MLHNALVHTRPRSLQFDCNPFERFFRGELMTPFSMLEAVSAPTGGFTPAVDVVESEDSYEFTVDLPGLTKKDVQITLENNTLTLSGERVVQEESEESSTRRMERFYGSFSRSFSLPQRVDADDAKATFKNGVLTLVVPKAAEARARKIEIH